MPLYHKLCIRILPKWKQYHFFHKLCVSRQYGLNDFDRQFVHCSSFYSFMLSGKINQLHNSFWEDHLYNRLIDESSISLSQILNRTFSYNVLLRLLIGKNTHFYKNKSKYSIVQWCPKNKLQFSTMTPAPSKSRDPTSGEKPWFSQP